MKTKKLIAGMIAVWALLFIAPVDSGATPPPWAPAHGYRAKTRHIYFPQQQIYFDLRKGVYIYPNNGVWIAAPQLPPIFAGINLRNATQVQIALETDHPYKYQTKYPYAIKPEYGKMNKATKEMYKDQRKRQKEFNKIYKKQNKKNGVWKGNDDRQGNGKWKK